jgi:photosystem II stability/assembly factor-like uncharacterized protein
MAFGEPIAKPTANPASSIILTSSKNLLIWKERTIMKYQITRLFALLISGILIVGSAYGSSSSKNKFDASAATNEFTSEMVDNNKSNRSLNIDRDIKFRSVQDVSNDIWTTYGPEGGGVGLIALDPKSPTTIYAGTGGGIFKSLDSGTSWRVIRDGLTDLDILSIVIDPNNPKTIYAGGDAGVFKSFDAGESWSKINGSYFTPYQQVIELAMDTSTPTTIYAATNGIYVLKSVDGGSSWVKLNDGLDSPIVYCVIIDPNDPSTIYVGTEYVGTGGGVYKSTNYGDSWEAMNNGLPSSAVYGLAIDPVNSSILYARNASGIFKSADGGDNWREINEGLTSLNISTIVVDLSAPTNVYAASIYGGLFKSIDSGETWTPVYNNLIAVIYDLAIDPITSNVLYAGTNSGVHKSTDEGENWEKVNSGLIAQHVETLAIKPGSSTELLAGTTRDGMYKSIDGGINWASVYFPSVCINDIEFDPINPTTIYASTSGGVWKSVNDGSDWTLYNNGLADPDVRIISVDPQTPTIIYSGTINGVFKSVDGGENWFALDTGFSITYIKFLEIDPVNHETIYAGSYINKLGVLESVDGGLNWREKNVGLTDKEVYSLAIDPIHPNILYVGTFSGVFKSTDGGENWHKSASGLTSMWITAIAIESQNVYAGGYNGVYKSTDGGENWNLLGSNFPQIGITDLEIDPINKSKIYAATYGASVFYNLQIGSHSISVSGTVTDGHDHALANVFVGLLVDESAIYTKTSNTDSNGNYCFTDLESGEDYRIQVILRNQAGTERILWGPNGLLTSARTQPFNIDGTIKSIIKNIDLADTSLDAFPIPVENLDDLAGIYFHTRQVRDFAINQLGFANYSPVESVWAFAPVGSNAFYTEDRTITIGDSISEWESINNNYYRPMNREWHENFHHLMNETIGIPPLAGGEENHRGYNNTTTQDSWAEGWATFWPCVLWDVLGFPRPYIYRLSSSGVSVEYNYQVWDIKSGPPREDLSVASLLWDLYDPVEDNDADHVDLSLQSLWAVIGFENVNDLTDMRDVYNAFQQTPLFNENGTSVTKEDIDEIFVSHGFFADVDEDQEWDSGEEVGWGGRTSRRNTPKYPNANIMIHVENSHGDPIDGGSLIVETYFDNSYYDYSYVVDLSSANDHLIYLEPPPSRTPVSIKLNVQAGSGRSDIHTIDNVAYWEKVSTTKTGFVEEHKFVVNYFLYLPIIENPR